MVFYSWAGIFIFIVDYFLCRLGHCDMPHNANPTQINHVCVHRENNPGKQITAFICLDLRLYIERL